MGDAGHPPLSAAAQRRLLAWGDEHRRDLPWRRTRDPWAVLVSEVMLQQTQVSRVAEVFEPFVEAFPTPACCAAAPVSAVVTAWGRLGYPRRAVRLRSAAAAVVEHHGGAVPDDLDALLGLPGVGAYTARAVLAFAFEETVGVVDTNAGRVLARWSGSPLRPGAAQALADESVPPGHGWAWNQTVFDLAASVCSRHQPSCDACPVRRWCAWGAAGCPAPDPATTTAGRPARQAAYEGSDRQARGRLMARLRSVGRVDGSEVAGVAALGDDVDRARRVAASLVADGLAAHDGGGGLTWPEGR